MIYFFIAFFACTLGAVAGLGGGLIIKPSLSLFTGLPLSNINILSSITIFSMAITSILKRKKANNIILIEKFKFLILGSLVGGLIGNYLFNNFVTFVENNDRATMIQSIILILLISLALLLRQLNVCLNLKVSATKLFLTGILFSVISTFLSIGGGPINVVILILLFGIDIKTATFTSILIIFTSQGSYLVSSLYNGQLFNSNLYPALLMIPGGILGGITGTKINIMLHENILNKVFNYTMAFLILLNILTIVF